MDHVVFFPAPGGAPAFRRTSSLEDAVRLVEHLRNVEGVEGATVHTLVDVPLSFKAYYRVEVPTVEPVAVQAAVPIVEPVAPALTLVEDLSEAGAPVEAAHEQPSEPVADAATQAEVPVQAEAPQEYASPRAANGSLGFFA